MSLINRSQAGTTIGKSMGAGVLAFALVVALLKQHFWSDPKNESVAEGIVTSAYQTASSSASNEQYDHWDWEKAENQYGRVLKWHITGHHMTYFSDRWAYEVEVMREGAETKEEVQATAGPSKLYGYFTAINSVTVESAHPRSLP